MDDVLSLDCQQSLHQLLQDVACLGLLQVAATRFQQAVDVSTVAVFEDKVVIGDCLGSADESDHVFVLDFCHDFDFIGE